MRRRLQPVILIALWLAGGTAAAQEAAVDADLLLRNGKIYDGSGAAPVLGDVAIKRGKIVGVGKFPVGKVDQTIDCTGLAVAPGFIDLHNHSDSPIVDPATRANVNFVTQGCTTVVTGNCGFGPVDVGAYFKKLDAAGAGTNVIHLLPHGSLRDAVMAKTARDPTTDELQKMRNLAEQAMRDGAYGMSTGLIYVPGTYSKTEEIVEVAKVVAAHDGIYASHIRGEGLTLIDAVTEALRVGTEAKLPVHVSHFKASGNKAWGSLHVAIELIEQARAKGQTVTADQYPYAASSTSLEATLLPYWCREGGRMGIEARLKDPETRAKMRAEIEKTLDGHVRVQIAGYNPRRDYVGRSVQEIATAEGRPEVDLVLEMEANGGAKIVNFGMNEDEVRLAMQRPWVATASDGSAKIPDADQPHPRNFGTFPRKLGVYAIKEKLLTLEQAVRSASGLPADILSLPDRGYMKVGLVGDVAVFDPAELSDKADFDRPYQYSVGMKYVFVGGVPTLFDGTPTGALPGRALKHETRSSKSKTNSNTE